MPPSRELNEQKEGLRFSSLPTATTPAGSTTTRNTTSGQNHNHDHNEYDCPNRNSRKALRTGSSGGGGAGSGNNGAEQRAPIAATPDIQHIYIYLKQNSLVLSLAGRTESI